MNQITFRGQPTIPEKENHLIYTMVFQKAIREGSKIWYEVEFSANRDCTMGEIREQFDKEHPKHKRKTKRPLASYFYVHDESGFWRQVSLSGLNDIAIPWWVRNKTH